MSSNRKKHSAIRQRTIRTMIIQTKLTSLCLVLGAALSLATTESRNQDSQRHKSGQFCLSQTVGQRIQGQLSNGMDSVKKVFCFYDIQDDFRPQDLNPCLCTHVVYSYVAVRKNLSFIAGKKGDLRSLASLKRKNPNLKLLVSLRPDDYFAFDSGQLITSTATTELQSNLVKDSGNNETTFSTTTPSTTTTLAAINSTNETIQMNEMHQKFAKRIRDFIVRHSLDGINLDWPYFSQIMPSANSSKEHLNLVLMALNENFQSTLSQSSPSSAYLRLQSPIVTLTISKDFYSIVDGYDFHQINKLVDYVHLPAFDFDLNVDQYSIGHPARLHGISDAENLDTLVDLLLSSGLPSEQLIAGLPSHGVQITSRPQMASSSQTDGPTTTSYTIDRTNNNNNSSSASNFDEQLEAAANISIISHSEVCKIRDLVKGNCSLIGQQQQQAGMLSCWTMSRARDLTAPFAYDSEHWVGFDDETSIKLKAKYVLLRHLAGVAMFTVNNDDPIGACGFGPYPLLATVNGVFARAPIQQPATSGGEVSQSSPSEVNSRSYFTRAPNQLMTATSLMSQIFGKKVQQQQSTASTPSMNDDLMQSASDIHLEQQQQQQHQSTPANHHPSGGSGLMSFVDIIEKYGAVSRLDAKSSDDKETGSSSESIDSQLACDRIGYQRYPRDCSRFYRCVQTPPATTMATTTASNDTTTRIQSSQTITRLQYECPSGLVFDEQYQICNWPSWSAQCTGSGEVNSITNAKFVCPNYGYFQNQENCEYFYYCSDYDRGQSQAYQFRCPFELGFDEEKLQCNWKWLVKGCNVSSPDAANVKSELAKKYLQGLEAANTTSAATTPTSSITTTTTTTATVESGTDELKRLKRSLKEEKVVGEIEGRSLSGRLTSLLASLDAIREYQMKKSGSLTASGNQRPGGYSGRQRYPSMIGSPQTNPSSVSKDNAGITSFRTRRRQATSSPSSSSDQSASASSPYKQRPPPPSMFPFLPASAIYMLTDSLRSFGEVIQGELNRYVRVAGDRVRKWFGPNTVKKNDQLEVSELGDEGTNKRMKRDTVESDDLEALESGPGASYVQQPHQMMLQAQQHPQSQAKLYRDPLGRPPGYPLNPLDDAAKSAVLGPEPKLFHHPAGLVSGQISAISQQEYERLLKSTNHPISTQVRQQIEAGYPFNQRQPAGMLASAASNINEQIVSPNNQDHVIGRILEQAKETFSFNNQNHKDQMQNSESMEVPFGMPTILRPQQSLVQQQQQQQLIQIAPTNQEPTTEATKKRRSTVAMRLATLAMPRFSIMPTKVPQKQPQNQQQQTPQGSSSSSSSSSSSKGYRSFLPTFGNAVVGPARNFMNKAMHNLISTLAPGSKQPEQGNSNKQQQQQQQMPTTPIMPRLPIPMRNFQHIQQLTLQHHGHQAKQQLEQDMRPAQSMVNHQVVPEIGTGSEKINGSSLPLLLTEQEAQALSAQLDQLSKEQLELLSSELFDQSQAQKISQQQQSSDDDKHQTGESQDYVVRLLRMLSQTSHNPEDVKLLDQLAGQLNNPKPGNSGDSSLIEVGQPDDVALLQALGLVPAQKVAPNQKTRSTDGNQERPKYSPVDTKYEQNNQMDSSPNKTQTEVQDNQQAASYNEYQQQSLVNQGYSSQAERQVSASKEPIQLIDYNKMQYLNIGTLDEDKDGTTMLVPVKLEHNNYEQTTPLPTMSYNNGQDQYQGFRDGSEEYQKQPAKYQHIAAAEQSSWQPSGSYSSYYPTTTTTTSTTTTSTTTTQRPNVITQIFEEQFVEKAPAPVKQTFMELVESNVTTPDGIETSIETRTKTAVSGAASFNIGAQVGLGLVTRPFDGQLKGSSRSAADIERINHGAKGASNEYSQQQQESSFSSGKDYNFANQPVTQMEEVVIKKKFKPFAKQSLVPQTTDYQSEEVRNDANLAQQQQLPVQQTNMFDHQSKEDDIRFKTNSDNDRLGQNTETGKEKSSYTLGQQIEQQREVQNYQFSINEQQRLINTDQSFKDLEGFRLGAIGKVVPSQISEAPTAMMQDKLITTLAEPTQAYYNFDEQTRMSSEIDQVPKKKSRSKRRKKQQTSTTTTTTSSSTTSTTSTTTTTPRPQEETNATKDRAEIGASKPSDEPQNRRAIESNRVESALSNFMIELKRSHLKETNSTDITTPETTRSIADESQPSFGFVDDSNEKRGRKSRSDSNGKSDKREITTLNGTNEQFESERGGRVESIRPKARSSKQKDRRQSSSNKKASRKKQRKQEQHDLMSSASSSNYQHHKVSQPTLERPQLGANRLREQVAIYGTKSGFMPIITPDDPSYSLVMEGTQNKVSYADPNNYRERNKNESSSSSMKDISWKNFVLRLSDQISVVNLGNFSELIRDGSDQQSIRLVQAKLIILPASPNNNLLNVNNWNYLASYYPQLFPTNRSEILVGAIELGDASISAKSGLINEQLEQARRNEFERQYEQVSKLIEPQTFKALDEIIQRSSGQMFMMHRIQDGSRTIIAVIPDKPLIRQQQQQQQQQPRQTEQQEASGSTPASQYQRQLQSFVKQQSARLRQRVQLPSQVYKQISSTTSKPIAELSAVTTTSTQMPTIVIKTDKVTPQRAATFSLAIQESIQNAIRQHYDSMKSQVRQSINDENTAQKDPTTTSTTTTTTTSSPYTTTDQISRFVNERLWSTPPAESLAGMESAAASLDPMDASGSSTEFSIVRLDGTHKKPEATATTMRSFASHSVYEVDGAEPKSLYGIELNSNKADQALYFNDTTLASDEGVVSLIKLNDTIPAAATTTQTNQLTSTQSPRFISIGSHLIASPKKLPKVVDQAYVNHFYDHIGDQQLIRSPSSGSLEDDLVSDTDEPTGSAATNKQQASGSTSLSEDSLVPESACTRAGLFQHPFACNKFYECFWDKQLNKYTLHMFECPIKLAFDDRIVGCAMPIESSLCVNY